MSILGLFGCGWMIAGLMNHDMDIFYSGLITTCIGLSFNVGLRK